MKGVSVMNVKLGYYREEELRVFSFLFLYAVPY
jgi:hypothetical protein